MSPLAYLLLIMAVMMMFGRAICSSSCGNIHNITSPFLLTTDPLSFSYPSYNLSCENNTTVLYLRVGQRNEYILQRYNVLAINYNNYTIRLGYPDLHKHDCSSIPIHGFPIHGLSSETVSSSYETEIRSLHSGFSQISKNLIFLNCESPVRNSSFIEAEAPCTPNDIFSATPLLLSQSQHYSYYYTYFGKFMLDELPESCGVVQIALISTVYNNNINNSFDLHNALLYGFELSWMPNYCYVDDSNKVRCDDCAFNHRDDYIGYLINCGTVLTFILDCVHYIFSFQYSIDIGIWQCVRIFIHIVIVLRIVIGILVLIALLIYIWRKQHLSVYDGIEAFLRSQNNLIPIRYSYRDIKKMTKGFKDKLGEGGFGSVYKGKLRSGRFVAIKMLSNSKASGQDFINEVATIGRIHHVNVVRLIGFSVEGSKRALVYDFMPNGSLDKFIFSREEIPSALGSKEMFEISIGIAHGIEYLHRGCDMKILHFDIKPHNILLDENFIPKVSDFGLARLCPTDNSMVSLTAARGTLGYMAPELYYKNIGGVSHKADVYSFGMLLMEMANKKRNLNAEAERTSQIYFPTWIFNQLSQGHDVEIENATEEESKEIKKMMIVALWCIQLKPCDRPSMDKAIKMLEGEVESLEMPPKLYLYPQESHEAENAVEMSSTLSNNESDEVTMISNSY